MLVQGSKTKSTESKGTEVQPKGDNGPEQKYHFLDDLKGGTFEFFEAKGHDVMKAKPGNDGLHEASYFFLQAITMDPVC